MLHSKEKTVQYRGSVAEDEVAALRSLAHAAFQRQGLAGHILEIRHSLAIVHEKAVQILYCDTLPSFKSCHWIPLPQFRLGADHTEALENTLILHLLTLCIGACVPVPYLSDQLILKLP